MKQLALATFTLLAACATNPNKATSVDPKLEYQEPVSQSVSIGVKDGYMVAQKQVMMSEELRKLQNDAYALEAKVYGGPRYFDNNGLYGTLRSCYINQAQGSGDITPMPERRSYVIPKEDYKIGLDQTNTIVGLEREYLLDRIARFRKYQDVLTERADEYQDKLDQCDSRMKFGSVHAKLVQAP